MIRVPEQELKRAVDDVTSLQAAADRLSPAVIRKQLDYGTLILAPKFSKKERGHQPDTANRPNSKLEATPSLTKRVYRTVATLYIL